MVRLGFSFLVDSSIFSIQNRSVIVSLRSSVTCNFDFVVDSDDRWKRFSRYLLCCYIYSSASFICHIFSVGSQRCHRSNVRLLHEPPSILYFYI
jgi:hypothetical protein